MLTRVVNGDEGVVDELRVCAPLPWCDARVDASAASSDRRKADYCSSGGAKELRLGRMASIGDAVGTRKRIGCMFVQHSR
jgi:hypothetical protein